MLATFRAACERWPGDPITLRQGARVIVWLAPDKGRPGGGERLDLIGYYSWARGPPFRFDH